MNNVNLAQRIPGRYWGYLAILVWMIVSILILRRDLHYLDESATRSLLIIWSIVDQVANAAVTFGTPDLRILIYAPFGYLWTGEVFPIKVFTLILLGWLGWLLYLWCRNLITNEAAILGTALFLICPLMFNQLDTLSPGIYLLLTFVLGAKLNTAYRNRPIPFGGNYFAQLLLCSFSLTLHPAGLAYVLVLLWSWHKDPIDQKNRKFFLVGIGLITILTLIIRMGWNDANWFINPIGSIAGIALGLSIDGQITPIRWLIGIIGFIWLGYTLFSQWKIISSDFLGRILLVGSLIGLISADSTWAVLVLIILLFFGLPSLLYSRGSIGFSESRNRMLAFLTITVLSTTFLYTDKSGYELRRNHAVTGQEQLIQILADEAEKYREFKEENSAIALPRLRVASQWPGRTMIACKCDTLPLPPATPDAQSQLTMMRGISYLLLDPQQDKNILLARNLSHLGGAIETIAIEPEGVLLKINDEYAQQDQD